MQGFFNVSIILRCEDNLNHLMTLNFCDLTNLLLI